MPINNLNNVHLNEAKKAAIIEKLTALENELADLVANLTAEERQLYGSVNEQHKLVYQQRLGLSAKQSATFYIQCRLGRIQQW